MLLNEKHYGALISERKQMVHMLVSMDKNSLCFNTTREKARGKRWPSFSPDKHLGSWLPWLCVAWLPVPSDVGKLSSGWGSGWSSPMPSNCVAFLREAKSRGHSSAGSRFASRLLSLRQTELQILKESPHPMPISDAQTVLCMSQLGTCKNVNSWAPSPKVMILQ